jgi:GTP-binding protein LepA
VRLDILVNETVVDALSCIVHREKAYHRGKALVHKIRGLIPRQMFEIPIQAALGNKIVSRENVAALRKMSWRNAMAAIFPASASCWKSRRPVKSA